MVLRILNKTNVNNMKEIFKVYKDVTILANKELDNKSSENISLLQKFASKLDYNFLSSNKIKDEEELILDIFIYANTGNRNSISDKLHTSQSLSESLEYIKELNDMLISKSKKKNKYRNFALDKEIFNQIQDFIVKAIKEQSNLQITEKLNYKLFL